jgi:hypothetical protein
MAIGAPPADQTGWGDMTQDDLEARIRERAYDLWTQEGRPDGRQHAHWEQARRELCTPGGDAVSAAEAKRESALAVSSESEPSAAAQPASGGGKRARAPGSTAADAAATVKAKAGPVSPKTKR